LGNHSVALHSPNEAQNPTGTIKGRGPNFAGKDRGSLNELPYCSLFSDLDSIVFLSIFAVFSSQKSTKNSGYS
jgi:hypothetical protein